MAVELSFDFPLEVLTQEARHILADAETYAATLNSHLPMNFVAQQRKLLGIVRSGGKTLTARPLGRLTISQNEAIIALADLMGRAKDTAKQAFKGKDAKLRKEFQVGLNCAGDLPSVLQRARSLRDACADIDNMASLAGKDWLATDTMALTNAIKALDSVGDTQESARTNKAANELYQGLLTIQQTAEQQWIGNSAMSAKFRLGFFPPRMNVAQQPPRPSLAA